MNLNWNNIKTQITKILIPQDNIGGLEINDKVIKLFYFDGDPYKIKYSNIIQIAPGAIKNGFLEKPEELLKSLTNLKNKTFKNTKFIPYIILSLPPNNFYTNILTIPKNSVLEGNIEESIKLNARMLSPIPLETAYLDWEFLPEQETEDTISVFIGIGDKSQIDKYLTVIQEVGFKIIAVEKPALGLLRFVQQYSANREPYLLIDIDRDGIDLILAKKDNLLFYDFDSWQDVMGYDLRKFLTTKEFENYLITKIAPIISFYQTRYGGTLKYFYLFSVITNLKGHTINFIQNQFMLQPVLLSNNTPLFVKNVTEEWYSVIGTARRGLIPRGQDTIISLMATGTETEYMNTKIINYVSAWTKAIITILLSLMILMFSLEKFLFKNVKDQILAETKTNDNTTELNAKRTTLEQEADKFNFYVTSINQSLTYSKNWNEYFKPIFDTAKKFNINILKMFISEPSNNITLQATGPSRSTVNDFKEALDKTGLFINITSPLESISEDQGTFYFSLKFGLKPLQP